MSEPQGAKEDTEAKVYAICIQGQLDARWAVWFEGMTITWPANGDTCLTGLVADQAALHGVLRKIRDLGLPLRSVTQIDA